jgi:N-acetylmuramic acid 6-phosphate etherase
LLFLLLGKAKLARLPLLRGRTPRYTLEMPSRKVARKPRPRRITEGRNAASKNLDRMSSLEIIRLMNREDRKVAPAVGRTVATIARAIDEIVARMTVGGRLIYVGAGSSGRIGVLDASECPPTFGVSPDLVRALIAGGKKAVRQSVEGAEDRPGDGARDLQKIRLSKLDSVVGIAASGTTPYVLGAIAFAKKRGALTIGVAANRRSPLASLAAIAITPEVGPETLAGSTRLKAGTSQKMVLNMLSTAVMVRLGHAYDNLMIDMGEANEKLRERAKWILKEASDSDVSAVTRALRQSGHDLRLALIMLKRGVSAKQARKILQQTRGNLRSALGERPSR